MQIFSDSQFQYTSNHNQCDSCIVRRVYYYAKIVLELKTRLINSQRDLMV